MATCCQQTDNELLTSISSSLSIIETNTSPDNSGTVAGFTSIPDVVTVVGTPVQATAHVALRGVLITASINNVGSIFIGGSGVTNAAGSQRGMELIAGGMTSTIIPVSNSNQIYINSSNSGDHAGIIIL